MLNLAFLCLSFTFTLNGQESALQNLFEKYDDATLSIDINIPSWLKGKIADIDYRGTRSAIKKSKRFKLLIIENENGWSSDIRTAKRSLDRSGFDELITIRDECEISMFLSEDRGRDGLREMIFFIDDHNDGILLSLKGEFTRNDVNHILDDINIECN